MTNFLASALVGSIGWAFVGEVASQKLRARTAGVAAAASVVFGLTFNTTVPLMCKSLHASLQAGLGVKLIESSRV